MTRIAANATQHFHAVHSGHHHVEEHNLGRIVFDEIESGFTVVDAMRGMSLQRKEFRQRAAGVEIVPGRASYVVRLFTPIAKGIQRVRGNGRIRPAGSSTAMRT